MIRSDHTEIWTNMCQETMQVEINLLRKSLQQQQQKHKYGYVTLV